MTNNIHGQNAQRTVTNNHNTPVANRAIRTTTANTTGVNLSNLFSNRSANTNLTTATNGLVGQLTAGNSNQLGFSPLVGSAQQAQNPAFGGAIPVGAISSSQGGSANFGVAPQGGSANFGVASQGGPTNFGVAPQGGPANFGVASQGGPTNFGVAPQGGPANFGVAPQGGPTGFSVTSQGGTSGFTGSQGPLGIAGQPGSLGAGGTLTGNPTVSGQLGISGNSFNLGSTQSPVIPQNGFPQQQTGTTGQQIGTIGFGAQGSQGGNLSVGTIPGTTSFGSASQFNGYQVPAGNGFSYGLYPGYQQPLGQSVVIQLGGYPQGGYQAGGASQVGYPLGYQYGIQLGNGGNGGTTVQNGFNPTGQGNTWVVPQGGNVGVNNGANVWGDPHFVGAEGGRYDVQGDAGKVYNLLSDQGVQVNAEFKGQSGATLIGKVGITIGENTIAVDEKGNVKVNGDDLPDGTYFDGAINKKGKNTTIKAGEYTLVTKSKGSHLDIDFASSNVASDGVMPHGIWGQSADGDGKKRMGDTGGQAQGGGAIMGADGQITKKGDKEAYKLYEVKDILDTRFNNFNRFWAESQEINGIAPAVGSASD